MTKASEGEYRMVSRPQYKKEQTAYKTMRPAWKVFLSVFLFAMFSFADAGETIKNGIIEISFDGLTVSSLKIAGIERLTPADPKKRQPGIAFCIDGNLVDATRIKDFKAVSSSESIEMSGQSEDAVFNISVTKGHDNSLNFHIVARSPEKGKDLKAYFICPTDYDFLETFRYDTDAGPWSCLNPAITTFSKYIKVKREEGLRPFILRQSPFCTMSYSDKYYLSFERTMNKDEDEKLNYSLLSVSNDYPSSNGPSFVAECRQSAPGFTNESYISMSFELKAGSFICSPFEQAMLDAQKKTDYSKIPQDAVFAIDHTPNYSELKASERPIVFSCAERVMTYDGVPIKNSSYKKIRDEILNIKKAFPHAITLVYFSPNLYCNADVYGYSPEKQQIFEKSLIKNRFLEKMSILYHERIPNYFLNLDPNGAYGKMLMANIRKLFAEIPEADGLFWDNFFMGAPSYQDDFDFAHGNSSLMTMRHFIKELKAQPEMKTRFICANGGLEPRTSGLIDMFLSETFARRMAALYPKRFGKPIFFLRKLGLLSYSDALFWNINPSAAFVHDNVNLPVSVNIEEWPEPLNLKNSLITPYEMYFPLANRYVVLARKFVPGFTDPAETIGDKAQVSLKDLGFKIAGNEKPPFFIEYFRSAELQMSRYQKYKLIRSFALNPDSLLLQPQTAMKIEPLELKVETSLIKGKKTNFYLVNISHKKQILNDLDLAYEAFDTERKSLVRGTCAVLDDGTKRTYVLESDSDKVPAYIMLEISNPGKESIRFKVEQNNIVLKTDENAAAISARLKESASKKSSSAQLTPALEKDLSAELLKCQTASKDDHISADNLMKRDDWDSPAYRIDFDTAGNLLRCAFSASDKKKVNSLRYKFSRWPGENWSEFRALGIWIYPATNCSKLRVTLLHSQGKRKGEEIIEKAVSLIPSKWNYVKIDFKESGFTPDDIWCVSLDFNNNWTESRDDVSFYIGGFWLLKNDNSRGK